jgi:endo-1,4-beta-xylanase
MQNPKYLFYFSLLFSLIVNSCEAPAPKEKSESGVGEASGLKDVSPFPVGGAVNVRFLQRDTLLKRFHRENFSSITATNDMKMYAISPKPDTFVWDNADAMVEYAEANNQRLFGHALVWHSGTPDWVKELAERPAELDVFLQDYISTYVGRYKGKVHGWDVVNEGIETAGGEYRKTLWYNALGKDYIAKAFRYAHAADPDAVLFYNDFNIERDTAKLHGVLRMINDLKQQGVPISGLGFQMHLRMDIPDETIAYCLKRGAETGLQIHLSEVDIIFNKHDDSRGGGVQLYPGITDEMREAQGEKYYRLVKMYRKIVPPAQQYGITFWGFNDRFTWINGFFNLKDWPTILDTEFQPKPAYYGFRKGLMD